MQVRTFYTAPTLIRALEAAGDKFVTKSDLSSLRILGTVGEPINAKAWNWYNKVIGGGKCPIVDTWWQTETGAILLTPLPGAWNLKPGSATLPFFGVQPVLLDEKVSNCAMTLSAATTDTRLLFGRQPCKAVCRSVEPGLAALAFLAWGMR